MQHKIYSLFLIIMIIVPTTIVATAQTEEPLVAAINYGMTVQETITDHAFFDWWQLDVAVGDVIVVSMEAAEGLQPLLGLLDSGGNLVTRSDLETVAEVDGIAFMQHTAVVEGQYTIIASRDGRDVGTTTGAYLLTVTNRNDVATSRTNPFLETEFRCGEWLITNALTFEFTEDVEIPDDVAPGQVTEYYRISAYGLDGFEPVIRIQSTLIKDRPLDCTDSAQATEGSELSLPFLDEPYTVTADNADNVAMVTITNSGDGDPLGDITVTIGAKEGSSGRYVVVLEGMELHNRQDDDEFLVRRGAFASDSILDVYMIGKTNNRLDSYLESYNEESNITQICDDIGRDDCVDLLSLDTTSITISEDATVYAADRFDSALRIDSPDNTPERFIFQSREQATFGDYIVAFVGELPPR